MQSTRLLAGLGLALCLGSFLVPAAPAHAHERGGRHYFDPHIHPHDRHASVHPRIVKGRPLPPGWGHRLSDRQLRHLPHYRGHEWRRVGSDLVLISRDSGRVREVRRDLWR